MTLRLSQAWRLPRTFLFCDPWGSEMGTIQRNLFLQSRRRRHRLEYPPPNSAFVDHLEGPYGQSIQRQPTFG
jgi:hypothetical protein